MMSAFRRFAAVAASLTAVSAMGVASASASASNDYAPICTQSFVITHGGVFNGAQSHSCALAQGSNAVKVVQYYPASGALPATTRYFYPGKAGKFERFRQVNTDLCLQLNYAGHKVIEATCSTHNYQMWEPTFGQNSTGKFVVYKSGYDTGVGLCLTFDEQNRSARTGILNAVKCAPRAWYQEFSIP